MSNYKLTVCYDGSRYRGWQKQGNTDTTIQGKLETLLSRMLEQPVEVNGSGRTDAGVHARAQVCSFRAKTRMPAEEILEGLRTWLPEDIGAVALEEAGPRFHARLSAVEKTYVYRIWNSSSPQVFERKYMYVYPEKLDEDAMRRAADFLCGTHDFTSFQANRHLKKSAVRTVRSIRIEHMSDAAGELRFYFTGDGFLYNMVRILTGTLLEVGAGMRTPESMAEILEAKDRSLAGPTAPAKGLCLWEVKYI